MWGFRNNGSNAQSIIYNFLFPIALTQLDYIVLVNATNDGNGIPSSQNRQLTSCDIMIKGPWGNWPTQYFNWLIIGY